MNRRLIAAISITHLFACAEGEKHAPTTGAAASFSMHEEMSHEPPLTLHIDGPSHVSPGDTIVLTITIRRTLVDDPIDLDVRLPPGAILIEGNRFERVADPGARSLARHLRVRVDSGSISDVVVIASTRGVSYGASVQAAYRFGRPEPMLPQPQLPTVKLGGGSASR